MLSLKAPTVSQEPPTSRRRVASSTRASAWPNWPPNSAGIRQIRRRAHLTELARQREVEAKGRAEVADLYE